MLGTVDSETAPSLSSAQSVKSVSDNLKRSPRFHILDSRFTVAMHDAVFAESKAHLALAFRDLSSYVQEAEESCALDEVELLTNRKQSFVDMLTTTCNVVEDFKPSLKAINDQGRNASQFPDIWKWPTKSTSFLSKTELESYLKSTWDALAAAFECRDPTEKRSRLLDVAYEMLHDRETHPFSPPSAENMVRYLHKCDPSLNLRQGEITMDPSSRKNHPNRAQTMALTLFDALTLEGIRQQLFSMAPDLLEELQEKLMAGQTEMRLSFDA